MSSPVPHDPVSTPNRAENHRFAITRARRRSGDIGGGNRYVAWRRLIAEIAARLLKRINVGEQYAHQILLKVLPRYVASLFSASVRSYRYSSVKTSARIRFSNLESREETVPLGMWSIVAISASGSPS